MTVVLFPENRSDTAAVSSATISLSEWLGGRWALLFSHPGDFDQEHLERDRWLSVLRRSFLDHEVRALTLARREYDGQGMPLCWLGELVEGCAAVLSTAIHAGVSPESRAGALRAQIARSGARFAMIIDSDLRCRRTVPYRAAVDLPSPLELVGWAVALRERQRSDPFIHRRNERLSDPCPCHLRSSRFLAAAAAD
jgi:hypothetical protein